MKSTGLFFAFMIVWSSHAQVSDFNTIDFTDADHTANLYKNEDLTNLPELAHKLTFNLTTDTERFRAIYRWVCNNIANDYGMYIRNKGKRERFKNDSIKLKAWNDSFRKRIFKKLLKDEKTICTGYAYLVRELAKLSNLECEIVQGYGRVSTTDIKDLDLPNHSWNAIKLNNKWYLCDPTWASGVPDSETNRFTFQYNDGFFLTQPELFAINHFPVEQKWWLLEEAQTPSFEEFLVSPIIYGAAYEKLHVLKGPKQMHLSIKKLDSITIACQLKKPTDTNDIDLVIYSGYNEWKTKPTSVAIDSNTLKLNYRFKSKGFYDVHLYISDDLILTYTVKVE